MKRGGGENPSFERYFWIYCHNSLLPTALLRKVNPVWKQQRWICQQRDLHLRALKGPVQQQRVPKKKKKKWQPDCQTLVWQSTSGHLMAVLSELYRLCWYAKDTDRPLEQVWGAITASWLLFYPSWLVSVLLPQDQFEGRTVGFVLPGPPHTFPHSH